MRINIAYCITQDFIENASVSAASILQNASEKDEYYFYIFTENFNNNDKTAFEKITKFHPAKIDFIKINRKIFNPFINNSPIGISPLYRLLIPSLLPNIDKILYLDADTYIYSNLAELYNYDITNHFVAGVIDKCEQTMRRRVKLGEGQTFINAGVLLLNLRAFRENNLEEKCFELLKTTRSFNDQDVINSICREKILLLPLKYNIMAYPPEVTQRAESQYENMEAEAIEAYKNPVIFHMHLKPWNNPYLSSSHDWIKLWNKLHET